MQYADFYLPSYDEEPSPGKGKIVSLEEAPLRRPSLEDEIRILRKRMEQLFTQEKSFTSDHVIAVSSLLDLKINEYMKGRSARK